jgi:hypothetical protein
MIEEVGKSKPASSISLPELHGRATPRERVLVVAEGGGGGESAFAWWPGALGGLRRGSGEGLAASDFVPQRQRQGHPPGKLLG